ncbi:putative 54S ribosomal protein L32, mitochondrial [Cyphellophora attinorum]|uniref:Large ribosomal subunit protein bL32m n=1 Tax=Cyphellophora attinorum TaxID=1664694 RepID=A0A0N1NXN4_9EURO|nr:putative 54S ribosomal protein L32, mitochondrial [Phialophora attinorum]KPI35794.1 putative 54S ribosomal protein L32, mitochondrial [Phialophora attinorum]
MASLAAPGLRAGMLHDLSRQLSGSFGLLRSSSLSIALPTAAISIPSILSDIWEGILQAVPKKKTSHMKKRKRFMHNNKLKDITAINKCPACGKPKRQHFLCPYCVSEIREAWNKESKAATTTYKGT